MEGVPEGGPAGNEFLHMRRACEVLELPQHLRKQLAMVILTAAAPVLGAAQAA